VVGKSGCDALVVLMEPADVGDFRNPPSNDGLSLPAVRRVHLQGQMRSPSVVVAEVVGEDPLTVPLVENGVLQALHVRVFGSHSRWEGATLVPLGDEYGFADCYFLSQATASSLVANAVTSMHRFRHTVS
jgi:hypothetical protein